MEFIEQYGKEVAGALVLLVLIVLAVRTFSSAKRLVGIPPNLSSAAKRAIVRARHAGDEGRVAEILFEEKAYEVAAERFLAVDAPIRAAESLELAGQTTKAVALFRRAGQPERAARTAEARGLWAIAGHEYVEMGDSARAAAAFAKAGRHREAAEHWDAAGKAVEAAEVYELLGDLATAAARRAAAFDEAVRMARGDVQRVPEAGEQARRAADLFARAGAPAEAAAVLRRAGLPGEAAPFYQQAGALDEAAQAYRQAGLLAEAANLLERLGRPDDAATCRGDLLLAQGDRLKAAAQYAAGHQHRRAAELYRDEGKTEVAARLFGKAGEHHAAAELWLALDDQVRAAREFASAGDYRHAAELLAKSGDMDRAAKLWEVAGAYVSAARVHVAAGRTERAIAVLEKVSELSTDADEAKAMLASLRGGGGRAADAPRGPTGQPPRQGAAPALGAPQPAASSERYEIIAELARGGMGVVYRARDRVLEREVAYKILSHELRDHPKAVKYFLREARAAAAMSHPNIVTVFDAGQQGDEYYMAMELVEGKTLKELVVGANHRPLPERLARYVASESCRGLAYAHNRGLVHRDIKSANIMLTRDKLLKIMDFGLAKFVEQSMGDHTKAIGTPYYMSPEQVLGRDLDGRSDLYSLGVTLFEVATGLVPFSKGDLAYHHLHTAPPRAIDSNPELSRAFDEIIWRCMQKKADDRFQSADELLAEVLLLERSAPV